MDAHPNGRVSNLVEGNGHVFLMPSALSFVYLLTHTHTHTHTHTRTCTDVPANTRIRTPQYTPTRKK